MTVVVDPRTPEDLPDQCGANVIVDNAAPRKTVADVLIAKAYEIAALKFHNEQLIATICSLTDEIADLNTEIGRLTRTIHDLRNPPPPPEPENESWQRLYADYRRYRRQVGYPGEKGSRR
ncbi:hypothetical protein FHT86_003508 [Rhizobium sp. BK313]|uniref:hypothetical protein n=1 Tax=Rhizobium sp. BK313 TaxID=2587081 RepID=UPI00105E2D0E|nr:hypothetical protein [Rhizobium sp. BK313]MBB3455209.1 hypothetical protein [Rhizobium sp. BK313]